MSEMTPEELLALAQGSTLESKAKIQEANLISYFTKVFNAGTNAERKEYYARRRNLRRNMLHIRKKLHQQKLGYDVSLTEEEEIVKKIVDEKLQPNLGLTWDTFTFQWDISPNPARPVTIIQSHEWFKDGGGIDSDIGVFHPTAFTKQEM